MANPIAFVCPHCQAQLRGPAELEGKKARCKKCGQGFVVKAAGAARSSPAAPAKPAAKGPAKPAPTKAAAAKPAPAKPAAPPPAAAADDDEDANMYTFASDDTSPGGTAKPATPAPAKKHFDDDDEPGNYALTDMDECPRCPYCAKEMESEDAIICLHCGYNTTTRSRPQVQRTIANTGGDRIKWLAPGIAAALVTLGALGGIGYLWAVFAQGPAEGLDLAVQIWGSVGCAVAAWILGKIAYRRLVLHPEPPEFEKK